MNEMNAFFRLQRDASFPFMATEASLDNSFCKLLLSLVYLLLICAVHALYRSRHYACLTAC